MKKFTLISFVLLLSVTMLRAQTTTILKSVLPLQMQQQLAKFSKNIHGSKIQTRSVDSVRLVGISYYTYNSTNYVITDSDQFTYTGYNGGTLAQYYGSGDMEMKFTTENSLVYLGGDFSDDTLITQTFNANDLVDTTIIQVWNTGKSEFENSSLSTFTYDGNTNPAFEYDFSWNTVQEKWLPVDEVRLAFTNNNLDTLTALEYSAGSYENYIKEINTYNSATNLVETTIYQEYNAGWQNVQKSIYLYDASNNDTSYVVQEYNGGWENVGKEVFNYSSSTNPYEAFVLNYGTSSWDSTYKLLYYYDASGNDTSVVEQQFDQGEWLGYYHILYQYDSYNQPTSFTILSYTNSSYVPEAKELYYYQNYATGINQLSVNNNQLSIYPNPTNGLINITSAKNIDGITVTDLLGQTILKSSLVGSKQILDLSGFSNGMYFVTAKEGSVTTTQKIILSK